MILTDSVLLEAGAKDFVYVSKKQPFSITCSPYLPKLNETYIDQDLALKMDIPIKQLQCTRIMISGHKTRIVGQISQTVQCVLSGKLHGTAHLKAKVVRDLNKLFNVDCIASQQLYSKLMSSSNTVSMQSKAESNSNDKGTSKDIYTNISHVIANDTHEDETISCDDADVSDCSHDADLLKFLSSQDEMARDQAFADYPELARLSKFFTKKSFVQPQPAVIYKDQATTDYSRPACKSPVSRSTQAQTELAKVLFPKPSTPVHQSLPAAAVPSAECDTTLAAIAASLPVGPTDAYIAALNAPPTELEDASDTSSVGSLARANGYDDTGPCDAPAHLNSYAMPHCMLCEVSGQPETIIFSHDTDDPYCPSYFSDDDEEEDPGGGRR